MTAKNVELNRIRHVLEEHDRTQTWLTKSLDLAFGTVNDWCNNLDLTDLVRAAESLVLAPAVLTVEVSK